MGVNGTHPTAIEAMNRIRQLCISKNVKYYLENANVEQSDQGYGNINKFIYELGKSMVKVLNLAFNSHLHLVFTL